MSRPNKQVKCIVCGEEVHYAKTWAVEIQKSPKVILKGRGCRKHKCVQVYVKKNKWCTQRHKLLNKIITTIKYLRDNVYTMSNPQPNKLEEIFSCITIFLYAIKRIITNR